MKKLLICVLLVHICKLYSSQDSSPTLQETLDLIPLPTASVIRSRLDPFFLPDFFTKTPILTLLAEKKMAKKKAMDTLKQQAEAYFKETDQPAGRKHFTKRIYAVEDALFGQTSGTQPKDFSRLYEVFEGKSKNTSKL